MTDLDRPNHPNYGPQPPMTRCPVCNGRGYHHCDCWPGDCICAFGDEDCDDCRGEGVIDTSYDEWDDMMDGLDASGTTSQEAKP